MSWLEQEVKCVCRNGEYTEIHNLSQRLRTGWITEGLYQYTANCTVRQAVVFYVNGEDILWGRGGVDKGWYATEGRGEDPHRVGGET